MVKEYTIRKACENDYREIRRICSDDLGYGCSETLVKSRFTHLDESRECVLVADVGGKAVGFIHIQRYDVLYFESAANVLGLAVDSRFRHREIGTALLKTAEEWATQNKIYIMRLNSGSTRKEAHAFYRNMGYENEKEQVRFMKSLTKY